MKILIENALSNNSLIYCLNVANIYLTFMILSKFIFKRFKMIKIILKKKIMFNYHEVVLRASV